MTALNTLKVGDKLTVMAVGKPGKGKSIAMASFPRPMQIHDFDFRFRPLLTYYKDKPEMLEGIDIISYEPHEYNKFAENMEKLEIKCPWKTVIIDSLTSLASSIVRYSISLRKGEVATGRKQFKAKGVIPLAEIEDYGAEASALGRVIDFGKVLPCHFLMTAHFLQWSAKNTVTQEEVIVEKLLTAGKGAAALMPTLFDEVWNFETKAGLSFSEPPKYLMRTGGMGDYPSKTALGLREVDWTNNKDFFGLIIEKTKMQGIELLR